MAELSELDKKDIQREYRKLLKYANRSKSREDRKLIRKAFNLANDAHREMRRHSGEAYIMHPIKVAQIVAGEIGLGTISVASALIHDVVEDTDYTIDDIKYQFGEKISAIIDGLTKISGVFGEDISLQAENFRKMLLTLSDDVRVILIKLADRLHNMRTLDSVPRNKQLKISGETSFLYAPLAHRLGLYAIKTEMEDLSLKYQHPFVYEEIQRKLAEGERKRMRYINKFSFPIVQRLEEENIQFNISGRSKSIYSIWKKMQIKNVPFEEIYDLFAIRIVFTPSPRVSEKVECWNIYSLITDVYQPNPDRLRDWVSTPKANGYEALHTTVMGPTGRWVEVQIRSERMDEIAERGFAAHWKYKGDGTGENELDRWLARIKELLENPRADALEFLDEFKMNLFSAEIFIFTPKGELRRLPKNSTALDFAYDIHTEIGNKAIGAKVNYKLVPLSHPLNSGDQVEIITSDKQKVQKEWLDFIITAKAKANIKDAFKQERKQQIESGKKLLEKHLKELNVHPNSAVFRKIFAGYNIFSKDELYLNIGSGTLDLSVLKKIINKRPKNKWIRYWQLQISKTTHYVNRNIPIRKREKSKYSLQSKKPLILNEQYIQEDYKIAKCCNPIPGDKIIGLINRDKSITIHKVGCVNMDKISSSYGDRIIEAKWKAHKLLSFLTRIKLGGIDRQGIVNQITHTISSDMDVNMRSLYFDANNGVFEGFVEVYVHDTKDLDELISSLKKVKGIDSVMRIESENVEETIIE